MEKLGNLLVAYGKISGEDLEEGLLAQQTLGLRIGETLLRLGKIKAADIEWVLSKQLDIPFVIVENIHLDPVLIGRLPKELLLAYRILPLYETDSEIALVTDDPRNSSAINAIEELTGKKAQLSAGNGERIEEILKEFFRKDEAFNIRDRIEALVSRIDGSSFYRMDFVLGEYKCLISIFGCGISKKIYNLDYFIKKEQVLSAFDSLSIPLLYSEHGNETTIFLSVYPMVKRNEDVRLPAVFGVYGFYVPEGIAFTDARVRGLPMVFHSDAPVEGYPFIFTRRNALEFEKAVYTIDSAPGFLRDLFVRAVRPRQCSECVGAGCPVCRGLGYTFSEVTEGHCSDEELRNLRGR
jgi:MshEN domain